MSYIYKITNALNGKVYIGKTSRSVEIRWHEHCKNCKSANVNNRPLYKAMNKYGIDSFKIETIETCPEEKSSERERYWIEYYQSFKQGYNATIGGDGTPYIDYDLAVATYEQIGNLVETASRLNIDTRYLSTILKSQNVEVVSSPLVNQQKYGKPVNQYDLSGKYLQTFPSIKSAAVAVGAVHNRSERGAANHISDVCRGKRQTAYGYKWQFA